MCTSKHVTPTQTFCFLSFSADISDSYISLKVGSQLQGLPQKIDHLMTSVVTFVSYLIKKKDNKVANTCQSFNKGNLKALRQTVMPSCHIGRVGTQGNPGAFLPGCQAGSTIAQIGTLINTFNSNPGKSKVMRGIKYVRYYGMLPAECSYHLDMFFSNYVATTYIK